ncbi:hypothetical protein GGR56DRAFT_602584 [Xylariaceae sp. FL0804]|nr:hypothetical protein GGR56DRAFT_602584 [Xylariaceae sp. FL0804]
MPVLRAMFRAAVRTTILALVGVAFTSTLFLEQCAAAPTRGPELVPRYIAPCGQNLRGLPETRPVNNESLASGNWSLREMSKLTGLKYSSGATPLLAEDQDEYFCPMTVPQGMRSLSFSLLRWTNGIFFRRLGMD